MLRRKPMLLAAALAAILAAHSAHSQDATPGPAPTAEATPAKPTPTPNPAHVNAAFVPFDGGVDPSTLTKEQLGNNIVVTGNVVKFEPSIGERVPHRITMFEEGDRVFEVVYWPDVASRVHGDNEAMPFIGQKLSVKGKIGEYRDKLQIRISNPKAIRLQGFNGSDQPPAEAPQVAAAANADGILTVTQVLALPDSSKPLTVEGEVASFKASWADRAPNLLKLTDSESEIEVVFFPNDNVTAPEELLKSGSKVRVEARRSDFNGKTQLKMLPGKEIRPAGSGPAPGAEAGGTVNPDRIVNSGDLDTIHIGKTVTVAGTLEGIVPASEGRYAVVRDRDGVFFVFISPELTGNADLDAKLANGNRLKVKGEVEFSKLRSQLVVVPKGGDSFVVAKSGE